MFNPQPKPKKSEKKKKKYIPQFSAKRAKQNTDYSKKRKIFLEDHKFCMVKGCTNRATEIHHKKGRIGDLLTDENFFLSVCHDCHQRIELNPIWAKENNYSIDRI